MTRDTKILWAGMAQSVERLATGSKVQGLLDPSGRAV